MPLVKLKANWPGVFRRSVRDKRGSVVDTLVFGHDGDPVELDDQQFAAVAGDIGHALDLVRIDRRGKTRAVATTAEAVVEQVDDADVDDGGPVAAAPKKPKATKPKPPKAAKRGSTAASMPGAAADNEPPAPSMDPLDSSQQVSDEPDPG